MLTRYRWYRVKFPKSNFDLNGVISGISLRPDADFWFSRIECDFGASMFRFLWRSKVLVTSLDDEGLPSYEEVSSVNFTNFALIPIGKTTFLRIENPGRNVRELLNALESIVGLGFTSKPVAFDKARPTTIFEHVDNTKLIGLKVSGAVVDEDLVARMEFISKQGMEVDKMKILGDIRYNVDSSVFELVYEGVRGRVTFASSGLVKVSGKLAPKLLSLIERDLPKLI